MTGPATFTVEERSFCVEIIQFPNVEEHWLEEKAATIERLIGERIGRKLEWHSVIALLEERGFRISFIAKPESAMDLSIPEVLLDLIHEATDLALPKKRGSRERPSTRDDLPTLRLGPRTLGLDHRYGV